MTKNKETKLQRYLNYLANHRLLSIVLLIGISVGALAAFTENLSKLTNLFSGSFKIAPDPAQLSAVIQVKNAGPDRIEIERLCEFDLTEDKGMMIQEYPKGRALLSPLDPPGLYGQYVLNGNETRLYQITLPNISGYNQLLERGAANIHFIVRNANSRQFAIGSLPFHRDMLRTYKAVVRINEPS